jgi:hypothetical protein
VIRQRPDLAGLPLREGKECRLSEQATRDLHHLSEMLRDALSDRKRSRRSPRQGESVQNEANELPWDPLQGDGHYKWWFPEAVPPLQQILMAEAKSRRVLLVKALSQVRDTTAAAALAQRALFDLDPEIRKLALQSLNGRPPDQYREVLVAGLRYPWAPAADHAAEALIALQMREALPDLLKVQAQGDPQAPFKQKVGGKEVWVIRELVRINHLGNCLMCHRPSFNPRDLVRGLVPTPGLPIPSRTSSRYYAGRRGATFVRADVTYLKQDFSVCQPVAEPRRWPKEQRYDYLVRVRPLTRKEVDNHERQQKGGKVPPLSEQEKAVLFALRELTGKDLGTSAKAWKKAFLAPDLKKTPR